MRTFARRLNVYSGRLRQVHRRFPFLALIGELIGSIQQTYLKKLFLFVPDTDKPYFEKNSFSDQACASFETAVFEMEEAGKCFALDRHTACVFHLMRVLEIGLSSLCSAVGFSPKNENWHSILRDLPAEIQKTCNPNCGNPKWKEDEHFYSELVVEFRHFRTAWRNYVMHAHEKYTRDEAAVVFSHVTSFMDHSAIRLTDHGVGS